MHSWKGGAALLVAAMAFAGCASDSDPTLGFTITPPDDPAGAYAFEADVAADSYSWDFGDHTPAATGESVTHAYSFENGKAKVTLKTTTGGETQTFQREVVRGAGTNAKPTFLLEAQRDWAVTGETVRFSGSGSFDTENDVRSYGWSCQSIGVPKAKDPHTHTKVPPFKAPPAGSVTSGVTNRTLPTATKAYPGDLCDALGSGTGLAPEHETIEGSFSKPGIYLLFMSAADAANPAVSGQFKIFVTSPAERPAAKVSFYHNATMTAGAPAGVGGQLQAICENAPDPPTCDTSLFDFALPAPGAAAGHLNFTYDAGPGEANIVEWTLKRGDYVVAIGDKTADEHAILPTGQLVGANNYHLIVVLEQGASVEFHATLDFRMDIDPYRLYE
ncbi:MAG: hypothetical protein QOD77_2163 [Thermoplasmata archaeon]|jgi:hypothetical protein|nr:hypothetical protein [Thermoplasmata archaeon]